MAFNLGRNVAVLGHDAQATATGTTGTVSGSIYDLASAQLDAIAFMVEIGATATNNGLKVQGATASGGTYSDLAGTFTTGHTTILMVEVLKPVFRFVKPQLVLGTSAHHGGIWAFGVGPRNLPTTAHTSALTYKHVNSPVSGTATSS